MNYSLILPKVEILNEFLFILISVRSILLVNVRRRKNVFHRSNYQFENRLDVGIDIQDDLGRHEVGFVNNTVKTPENNGEGCRINASFTVNRVPGNFHISTHSAAQQPESGTMKHFIHELTFGDSIKVRIHSSTNNLQNTRNSFSLGFSTNSQS